MENPKSPDVITEAVKASPLYTVALFDAAGQMRSLWPDGARSTETNNSGSESTGGKGMDSPPTHPRNQISPDAKWRWLIFESEETVERISGFIPNAGFPVCHEISLACKSKSH